MSLIHWQVVCLMMYSYLKNEDENFREELERKPAYKLLWLIQAIGFILQILFCKMYFVVDDISTNYSGRVSGTSLVVIFLLLAPYCVFWYYFLNPLLLALIVASILTLRVYLISNGGDILTGFSFIMAVRLSILLSWDRLMWFWRFEIVVVSFYGLLLTYVSILGHFLIALSYWFILIAPMGFLLVVCAYLTPDALNLSKNARTMITCAVLLQISFATVLLFLV